MRIPVDYLPSETWMMIAREIGKELDESGAELTSLRKRVAKQNASLLLGRGLGLKKLKDAAAVRHERIEQALLDRFKSNPSDLLLSHDELARWLYEQQSKIGIRKPYRKSSILSFVKRIAARHRVAARERRPAF